jgi:hypothetical protein
MTDQERIADLERRVEVLEKCNTHIGQFISLHSIVRHMNKRLEELEQEAAAPLSKAEPAEPERERRRWSIDPKRAPYAYAVVTQGGYIMGGAKDRVHAETIADDHSSWGPCSIVPVYLNPAERGAHPLVRRCCESLMGELQSLAALEAVGELRQEVADAGGLDKLLTGEPRT